ncbi:MAG TPA: hypothetical protein VFB23_10240 [Candidatus Acidoferrales bacterium]|nr:hypothetical protein [Candidatus Acidoferrales bacterium]
MTLSVELNELPDAESGQQIEAVIRRLLGDRLKDEEWKLWIYASATYCRVVVKGPVQKREKFFFDGAAALPEKVGQWLESYPLR